LSDIVMPGISGLELGRLVREYHPEIRMVLASGYSDKAAVATEEGFTLIRKPYSPETLHRILAGVMKENSQAQSAASVPQTVPLQTVHRNSGCNQTPVEYLGEAGDT
jgi:two-component system, NtrC family, sensor kinase